MPRFQHRVMSEQLDERPLWPAPRPEPASHAAEKLRLLKNWMPRLARVVLAFCCAL